MDTISNFLTTIRNAYSASHASCVCLFSNVHLGIAKILKNEGYISDVEQIEADNGIKSLKVTLKYVDDAPAIEGIERVSKQGRRVYTSYLEIPRVLSGMGISILTTPKGILCDRDARKQKVGGELICKVW